MVVEAALGQGEVVVSGAVEPDTYEIAPEGLRLRSVRIGHQDHGIIRDRDGEDRTVTLDEDLAWGRVLSDVEAVGVAKLALRVQDHFGVPQDVEWAVAGDRLWLLQARPITTLAAAGDGRMPLVAGIAASPGRVAGKVKVLHDPADGSALQPGEVLVAPMTNPDWLPTTRRARAVVTDSGGATCHAAIAARELGVPCVVGTRAATAVDGCLVTVDGTTGEVFDGDLTVPAGAAGSATVAAGQDGPRPVAAAELLGTQLYVNLAMPDAAARVAARAGIAAAERRLLLTAARAATSRNAE